MDLDDRLGTMRFLIHDHDPIFTTAFGEVFKAKGLRIVPSLPRTPRMNAICERVIRTLRRELLNRTLILGDRHRVPDPLQPSQATPVPAAAAPDIGTQPIWDVADLRSVRRRPVVAGLINEYHHAALSQLRPRNSIFERDRVQAVGHVLARWPPFRCPASACQGRKENHRSR